MPITGHYMVNRIQFSILPFIKAYGEWVLEDVEPTFKNLSEKADVIASADFNCLSKDCDGDMIIHAEDAQDKGQYFYNTMTAIRQSSLNLFAAGLFHLLEQQLAELCRDGVLDKNDRLPLDHTKLCKIKEWYLNKNNFNLDLSNLSTWPKIDQLRLLANSVKHGEGESTEKLRKIRPDLYQDPHLCKPMKDILERYSQPLTVRSPMSGDGIFVTNKVFTEFSQAVNSFVAEIAEYFDAHREQHFLVV